MRMVIVEMRALDGKELEVRDFLQAHAARSRMYEPGCVDFQITVDEDNPQAFFAVETYKDADAHAEHRAMAHFNRLVEECFPLLQDAENGTKFFTRRIMQRVA